MSEAKTETGTRILRSGLILLIVVLAFIASYQLAQAANSGSAATGGSGSGLVPVPGASGGTTSGCACCPPAGASAEPNEGTAVLEGDVQRIAVDATSGYDPNVIRLKAGVTAEITFSEGTGCMAEVMSEDFGFFEDLTRGPVTVRIEAERLQPGEYGFSCGMQMVFGTIIVE